MRANACAWYQLSDRNAWMPGCKTFGEDPSYPMRYTVDFGGAWTPLTYGYLYCQFCGGWLQETVAPAAKN